MNPIPLRYGNVVCGLLAHDAEWSRRNGHLDPTVKPFDVLEPFNRVFDEVASITRRYRDGLERHAEEAKLPDQERQFAKHLFEPLCYLPIGHADALTITLFDDFDPIHALSSQCSTTVEEVTVGFSPLVESIWNGPGHSAPTELRKNIVNIEEFFKNRTALAPALAFCRLKLSPVCLLGGSLFAHAAMVRKIASISEDVLSALSTKDFSDFEITKPQVKATRISILDIQGQEEIGILISTANFSIAGAILSRLQCVTVADLAEYDDSLLARPSDLKWISNAVDLLKNIHAPENPQLAKILKDIHDPENPQLEPQNLAKDIAKSHALRWTRSSLAIQKSVFFGNRDANESSKPCDEKGLFGFIDLISDANIAVGHQLDFENSVEKIPARSSLPKQFLPDRCIIQLIGASDAVIHHHDLHGGKPSRFIPVRQAIAQVFSLMEASAEGQDGKPHIRHLVGLSSVAAVPTPNDEGFIRTVQHHFPILQTILPVIRWRMMNGKEQQHPDEIPVICRGHDDIERKDILKRQKLGEGKMMEFAPLCCYKLRTAPRKCLLPAELIRKCQAIFNKFATLLSNPYVFDSVIDMYDSFASLHKVLVEHLPATYAGESEARQLPGEVVTHLARYIGAIDQSLTRRLYHAFPEDSHRETDIDFRGGLNQLISGADALVKAATGLVKRYAEPPVGTEKTTRHDSYDVLGIINRIDSEPDIQLTLLELGIHSMARLGIIRSDVPHLCVVASYLDFIHEIAHVAYAERRDFRKEPIYRKPLAPIVPLQSMADDHLSEIYSNAFTALLICRDEPDYLIKHQAITFSLSSHHGILPEHRLTIAVIYFFRLFIVQHVISELRPIARGRGNDWTKISHSDVANIFPAPGDENAMEKFTADFSRFFQKYCAYCWDSKDYLQLDNGTFVAQRFYMLWNEIRIGAIPVLLDVIGFFSRSVQGIVSKDGGPDFSGYEEMEEMIQTWIGACDPGQSANVGIPTEYVRFSAPELEKVDHMMVIAGALRTALKARMDAVDERKTIHVPLNKFGGVEFGVSDRNYSIYMIRPSNSFLFCCSSRKRRERLQRQITLHKTLWHASSTIKADRFAYIIKNQMSVPNDKPAPV